MNKTYGELMEKQGRTKKLDYLMVSFTWMRKMLAASVNANLHQLCVDSRRSIENLLGAIFFIGMILLGDKMNTFFSETIRANKMQNALVQSLNMSN